MKLVNTWRFTAVCLFAIIFTGLLPRATAQVQTATSVSAVSDYVCVQRGPHSRIWQQAVLQTNAAGVVRTNVLSYTERATGICYLQNGQYVDSVEEINPVADGAQAVQGRYQVHWAANANTAGGAVNLTTPDNKQLSSTIFGLLYYDNSTGSNVLLAQLQDCSGTIKSNTLTYANAFSNLTADVRYTYRKAGLSQDIVLRQQPPSPTAFGLNPDTTYLQVLTEFYNSPSPIVTTVTNNGFLDSRLLNFGDMKMGVGHAFLFQSDTAVGGASVAKSWTNFDNRTFLIEGVRYTAVSNLLSSLHSSNIKPDRGHVRRSVSLDPPKPRKVSAIEPSRPVRVAQSDAKEAAFVLDYELLSSETNYTFQGDTTYYVSGLCNLSATTILEGGTVIKFKTNTTSEIAVEDDLVCDTADYRPAVLTSMNDNTVGATITGSTGNPWGNNAGAMALYFPNRSASLQHIRFSHLAAGVSFEDGSWDDLDGGYLSMSDFQAVDCGQVIMSDAADCQLFNGLVYNVGSLFGVYSGDEDNGGETLTVVNLTVHHCGNYAADQTSMMYFTNCLFAEVTNIYWADRSLRVTNSTVFLSNDSGVFQTVGAGMHYLATNSPYTNFGTTNITMSQLDDLQTKTYCPPVTNFSGLFSSNYTFGPVVPRDNSGSYVAIGYHYCPIDYAVNLVVSNATMTVLPGTSLALMGSARGLYLYAGANLQFLGSATEPINIGRYNDAQEMANTNWSYTGWQGDLDTLGHAGTANFRFVNWSALANNTIMVLYFPPQLYPVSLFGCQFYNGNIDGSGPDLLATNCLFQRIALNLDDDGYGEPNYHTFYNNLFECGSITNYHDSGGTWTFSDNLFDQTLIWQDNPSASDYNGYVTNFERMLPAGSNDVVLTSSPAYEWGTLGDYYYPTNLSLIHAGSRCAAAAGLYHYTVTTNNIIDGDNTVSIGFHYVATDTNAIPLDTTGGGIPDYFEDLSSTNFTIPSETPPLSFAVTEPASGWPSVILGQEISATATPAAGLAGLEMITTTNGCSLNTTILLPTNSSILSFWWQTTGAPFIGGGNGPTATFIPTNMGTGNLVFNLSYVESPLCGGATNTVSITNSYTMYSGSGTNAPSIITQPLSQTVTDGSCATFSVTAIGYPTLTYQWFSNGNAIENAGSNTFTITNAQISNAGSYDVVVTNIFGSVTSSIAVLDVQTCAPFENGSFEEGFSGWDHDGLVGIVESNSLLQPADGNFYAEFTGWNQNGHGGTISQSICVDASSNYQISFDYAALLQGAQTNATLCVSIFAGGQCLYLGQPNPTANWQTDTVQFQVPVNANVAKLTFFRLLPTNAIGGTNSYAPSTLDNVVLQEVTNQYPVITQQPTNCTVDAGASPNFAVQAAGPNLSYQWLFNGIPIPYAGYNGYSPGSCSRANEGTYSVIVSNAFGNSVRSSDAVLTVIDPAILTQPQSIGVTVGSGATWSLSVQAGGTPIDPSVGLLYQWYYTNGNVVTNAYTPNSSTLYSIPPVSTNDMGAYYVVVTGLYGSVTSAVANVTVFSPPPFITAQPQGTVACIGDSPTFSVTAIGDNLTFQWFANGLPIPNATSSTYTIQGVTAANYATYTVTVENSEGITVTSAPAILYSTPSLTEGDVVVAMDVGTLMWFLPDGTPKYELVDNTGNWNYLAIDMCFDSAGDVICDYGNIPALSQNDLCSFSYYLSGPIPPDPPMLGPSSVALDAAGNTYVGTVGGSYATANPYGILEFNSSGQFIKGYLPNVQIMAMDLDADQSNIFYIPALGSEREIWKLPVGTATGNPVLFSTLTNDPGCYANGLRILPDGSVLVADSINVKWNTNSSTTNGTAAIWDNIDPNWFNVVSISLDPSGTSFWVSDRFSAGGDYGEVVHFDLNSGNLADPPGFYSGSANQGAVAVIGDLRMGRLITQQPLTQTVCPGGDATFTVAASQRFPYSLSYAWYQNGTMIPGATNTSFTTNAPGLYTVQLTSPDDPTPINVMSAPAALIMGAPTIEHQPASQTLSTGAAVDFSVVAEGSDLSYQWYYNGSPIIGATNADYSIGSVTTNSAGPYYVVVSSCANADSITSSLAVLSVYETEPLGYFSGMVDWWPADATALDSYNAAQDIIGYQDAALNNVSFGPGEVNQAFFFNGIGEAEVDSGNVGNFGLGDFSVEFWVQSDSQENEELICYSAYVSYWQIQMLSGRISMALSGESDSYDQPAYPPYPFSLTSSNVVNDGKFHHVLVSRQGLTNSIYIDGALSALANSPGVADLTWVGDEHSTLYFGNGWLDPDVYPFVGALDEIILYDRALSPAEVQLAYSEGSSGKLPRLGDVVYSVSYPCESAGDYSEEITLSDPLSPNATIYYTTDGTTPTTQSAQYEAPLNVGDFGNWSYPPTYFKAIAVEPGYVNGPVSPFIQGLNAPSIDLQPLSQSVAEDNAPGAPPVNLTVVASSPAPIQNQSASDGCSNPSMVTNLLYFGDMSYQWYFNGGPVQDATNSILSVSPVAASAGSYMVLVSNACGTAMSSLAVLQISPNPDPYAIVPLDEIIAWWPAEGNFNDVINDYSGEANPGNSVYFVPGYVGQGFSFTDNNGNPTGGVVDVSDYQNELDSTAFTIEAWVYFNDARPNFPTVTSGRRTVVEKGQSAIQYQLTYSAGGLQGTIGNSVCAGTVPLGLDQWHHVAMTYDGASQMAIYLDGALCGSAAGVNPVSTSDDLLIGANSGVGDVLDEIILYNTNLNAQTILQHAGSPDGIDAGPTITAQPQSVQICAGQYTTLNATAMGRQQINFQWQLNGVGIPGAEAAGSFYEGGGVYPNAYSSYRTTNGGTYTVVAYDSLGRSVLSAPAIVTISSNPATIVSQPQSYFASLGSAVTLYLTATGDNVCYQWLYNNANIPNATNSTLVITNVQLSQSGTYTAIVTNACAAVSSNTILSVVDGGNVVTWGTDLQLPLDTNDNDIIAISSGNPQCLALKSDGTVAEWIPGSSATHSHTNIAAISAGSNYNLYLTQSGSVLADGNDGGSGAGSPPSSVTNPSSNGPLVVGISAGPSHALALMANQTVIGWGQGSEANAEGQTNIIAISAGYKHSLVLNADGTVASWGSDVPPGMPAGLSNVVAISAGSNYDLALQGNGSVVAWGNNNYGVTNIPQNLSDVIEISAGAEYGMAVVDGGDVVVWGTNFAATPESLQAVDAIAAGTGSPLAVTVAPVITSQPEGETIGPGTNVILNVSAVNVASSSPLTYDWQSDGQDLGGGYPSYTNYGVQANGEYNVFVANDYATTVSDTAVVVINGLPPTILDPTSPVNQSVPQGGSATFSVTAIGTGTLTYQWTLNGSDITAATSSSYAISSAQASDAGDYKVLVTNNSGATWSPDMRLVVQPQFAIVQQPVSENVAVGNNAAFSVQTIGGIQPLDYEWYYTNNNGEGIQIGSGQTLEIDNVPFDDAGQIYATITDANNNQLTTQEATLTVVPVWTVVPPGIVAWWRAEDNANDSVGTNNATNAVVTYVPGEVGQAFKFDGISDAVTVPDSPSLALTNTSFTIEGWIYPYTDVDVGYEVGSGFIVDHGNTNQDSYSIYYQIYDECLEEPAIIFSIYSDDGSVASVICPVAQDEWQHIAAIFDANAQTLSLYVDGELVPTLQLVDDYLLWGCYPDPAVGVTNTVADNLTGAVLGIGNSATWDPTLYPFPGLIDELSIYTNALGSDQIEALYSSGNIGKQVGQAPVILCQPRNQTAFTGSNVVFAVTANGQSQLTYQWLFDGNAIDETGSALTLEGVAGTNSGTYSVIVTDEQNNSTTSSNAVLVVGDPVIFGQPQAQTAAQGTMVSFSVEAIGSGLLAYQWQSNGMPITGATSSIYNIGTVDSSSGGTYSVIVGDASGSVTSAPAVLRITNLVISSYPSSQCATQGSDVTFNIGVASGASVTYQWSLNGTNLADNGRTFGTQTSSLSISGVQLSDVGSYSVSVNEGAAEAQCYLSIVPAIIASPLITQVSQGSSGNPVAVLSSAVSAFNATLSVSGYTQGQHGVVSSDDDGENIFYDCSAEPNYYGIDVFSFTISDGQGGVATNVATVFVNNAGNQNPVASDQTMTLQPGQLSLTFNPLQNCSDPDGDVLTVYSTSKPRIGSVVIGAFGTLIYTRNSGMYGDDSFTYLITDGKGGYATGTVIIKQADNNGNGVPDQWEIDNNLPPSEVNPMADPLGDGLPTLGKYLLGVAPSLYRNPLNIAIAPDVTGEVFVPLSFVGDLDSNASFAVALNGSVTDLGSIVEMADKSWWLILKTATLAPGCYQAQIGIRYQYESSPDTVIMWGSPEPLKVHNSIIINPLCTIYSGFLGIEATVLVPASSYEVDVYNYDNQLLTSLTGAVEDGQIATNWDLTDLDGNQIDPQTLHATISLFSSQSGGNAAQAFSAGRFQAADSPPINQYSTTYQTFEYGSDIIGQGWVVGAGGGDQTPPPGDILQWPNNAGDINANALKPLAQTLFYLNILPAGYNAPQTGNCFEWHVGNIQEKTILMNALGDKDRNSAFFYYSRGHGSTTFFCPQYYCLDDDKILDWDPKTPDVNGFPNHISVDEVCGILGNSREMAGSNPQPYHYKSPDQQPYRLVILMTCNSYCSDWAESFGLKRFVAMSRQDFNGDANRPPVMVRAFVGCDGNTGGYREGQYAIGEQRLFRDWCNGQPISACINDFKAGLKSTGDSTLQQFINEIKIAGCVDLTYHDGGGGN